MKPLFGAAVTASGQITSHRLDDLAKSPYRLLAVGQRAPLIPRSRRGNVFDSLTQFVHEPALPDAWFADQPHNTR